MYIDSGGTRVGVKKGQGGMSSRINTMLGDSQMTQMSDFRASCYYVP